MKKSTKTVSLILVCMCFIMQLAVYTSAVDHTASYDVFLRNFQEKKTFASGPHDGGNGRISKITFTGGTANYIYIQVQNMNGTAISSDWKKIANGTTAYVNLPHETTVSANTTIKIVGYQKNIDYKSAKGDIIF